MRALIIDDEPDLCWTLARLLARLGWQAETAHSCAAGLALARAHPFDLVITDLRLPDGSGIGVVEQLAKERPEQPVAVLTAYGDIDTAVRATKLGAIDFLTKPIGRERLAQLLAAVPARSRAEENANRNLTLDPEPPPAPASPFDQLIGQSAAIVAVRAQLTRYARSLAPVLLQGPSGSGKELCARLLHEASPRAAGSFIAVNCGAIPAELLESELFGVKKGAFTGATGDRPGLIAAANGGTLFLDEIAELPLPLQPKLLRVLQERTIRPLGATHEQPIDVRFVAATHVDLAEAVAAGRFREDLYYRLAVLVVTLPALTERRDDIPLLAEHLARAIAARDALPPPCFTSEALTWLCAQPWPGNVRELHNLLERALAVGEGPITAERLAAVATPPPTVRRTPPTAPTPPPLSEPAAEPTPEAVRAALAACGGNQSRAAQQLGLTLSQLRYRLRKWGLT